MGAFLSFIAQIVGIFVNAAVTISLWLLGAIAKGVAALFAALINQRRVPSDKGRREWQKRR